MATVATPKKSLAEIKADVLESLNAAIADVEAAKLRGYVVVFADGTPVRTDGRTLAIYGAMIFSTVNNTEAQNVAENFSAQLRDKGSAQGLRVERAGTWQARRVEQLRGMITEVESGTRPGKLGTLATRALTSEQRAAIISAINIYGTQAAPLATPANIEQYKITYAAQCVRKAQEAGRDVAGALAVLTRKPGNPTQNAAPTEKEI